ncbi:MAG: hypothetical protein NZ553_15905 [Caldilinea sp.]|nr:hypothetical protein [Caldilinea sp.]MDW8441961.1 two-component regulator propeller domain-containing protein [Caldilineaceae bacterium]
MLLLVALIGTIGLTLRSQPAVTIRPAPTPTRTATPTLTPTSLPVAEVSLVAPAGGYRVQPPSGYEAVIQGAEITLTRIVSATAETQLDNVSTMNLDVLPVTALEAGADFSPEEAALRIAQPLLERIAGEINAQESITVGGRSGVALSAQGTVDGESVMARIVVAPHGPGRIFVAVATAPAAIWEVETAQAFAHVLQSISFFEPEVVAAEASAQTTLPPTPATALRGEAIAPPSPTPTIAQSPAIAIAGLVTPTPTPASVRTGQAWTVVSDGNRMNDLAIAGNTIWIASDGGALAWTRGSTTPVKFTTLNGLTANRLTAVANCPLPDLGGVLFGSEDGLQVIDPRAGGWRQVNSRNSELRYDDVSALACDAEAGYLVVGYARHGIDVFDARTGQWRHLDRNSGLASNNVRKVAVVGALEQIWVAADDGVTVAAGPDSTFYSAANSPLENNRIGAVAVTEDGAVWLGGEGVLYRIEGDAWTVFNAEEAADAGFPLRLIVGIAPTADGHVWIGDVDGALCRFDPATTACVEAFRGEEGIAGAPLTQLTLDTEGRLYVTTAGDGFSVYDGADWRKFVKANEGIRGNAIRSAAVGPDGALWTVTDGGVQRVVAPNRPPEVLPDSGVASIRTLYAARNGALWVAGEGAGVWDGESWTLLTTEDGLLDGVVQAIAEDSRGRIWLGTDVGVSIWNGALFVNLTEETGLPSGNIQTLLPDGEAMWIGSAGGGLYRFVRNQLEVFTAENMGLPSNAITALAKDGDLLYIGTDAGLVELRNGAVAPIPAVGERSVTQILAQGASLWVGTRDAGLFYDLGDGWRQETTEGALPSNHVTAIVGMDNAVWIGGAVGGFVRYSMLTKE